MIDRTDDALTRWRESRRILPSWDHRKDWARFVDIGTPTPVGPTISGVETWEYGVYSYKSLCRRCHGEVDVYGANPHRFCPSCGEAIKPKPDVACAVCGSRDAFESLKQQNPGKSVFYVGYPECHECGHRKRRNAYVANDHGTYTIVDTLDQWVPGEVLDSLPPSDS